MSKKSIFICVIFFLASSTSSVQAGDDGDDAGHFQFNLPALELKIGPSLFLFAGGCATLALVYLGIKKMAREQAMPTRNRITPSSSEGKYLLAGGACVMTATMLATYAYKKYYES